jgi:glycosyltransferase involved in cell wall biosynthesis
VYGSLAANLLGIPVINNIAGLGSAFIKNGLIALVLKFLYRVALSRSKCVFFQNPDDLQLFSNLNLVTQTQALLLPGSGVDLKKFQQLPLACFESNTVNKSNKQRSFVFLLVARLLRDKGIDEYVNAARILKERYPQVKCALLGFMDEENPNSIGNAQMHAWLEEGVVSYWGTSNDVRLQLTKADCVVLPSYREGTPRTLLEAAAMGRPLIATDVPGCREVVRDGINGLLCLPRDSIDLAKKMELMISFSNSQLQKMSDASRKWVEDRFSEQVVIDKYRKILIEISDNELAPE